MKYKIKKYTKFQDRLWDQLHDRLRSSLKRELCGYMVITYNEHIWGRIRARFSRNRMFWGIARRLEMKMKYRRRK